MLAYTLLPLLAMAVAGGYLFICTLRMLRFYRVPKAWWNYTVAAAVALFAAYCCRNLWLFSALIVLHLVVFLAAADLVALPIRHAFRSHRQSKPYRVLRILYRSGAASLLAACMLLGYGMWNMAHIRETTYTVISDKVTTPYRIALITDTHYGTIQDKELLKSHLKIINDAQPDLVILGGDLVDEGTSKADMQVLFDMLGSQLHPRYGIFYVYGNHDRQPYTQNKAFTADELKQTITESGIHILQDASVELGDELLLAGRDDARWGNSGQRTSTDALLQGADRSRFMILADHQPVELSENAAASVDLMLSGHTHAGQIWPVGLFSSLTGVYNYGLYQEGDCTLIVSSGFTGWGYPIRTQGHCEYVLVDLIPKK